MKNAPDSDLIWTENSTSLVHTTPIFNVEKSVCTSPAGKQSDFILLQAPDWVTVLPVLKKDDKNYFLMVRQWRHGQKAVSTEFPGGGIDKGETPEEAALIDDKLIAAWTGHPHFRVIDNRGEDFEYKMKRLISEISSVVGDAEVYETERKFLIEYPDTAALENDPNCTRVEIIQTYLNSNEGEEVRVRQRGCNGHFVYYKTVKRKVSDLKRVEIEKRLSQEEYLTLLMDADPTRRQIRKTRYCLTYNSQYFEIDVYPFWNDKAIVEIELSDENAEIDFPKAFRIIKEVTNDESYKNASIAKIK